MKTINFILEEIAIKKGFKSMDELICCSSAIVINKIMIKVAEMHAKQCCDEHNSNLNKVLQNLINDIGGGKKACGHDFSCSCAFNAAKEILSTPNVVKQ